MKQKKLNFIIYLFLILCIITCGKKVVETEKGEKNDGAVKSLSEEEMQNKKGLFSEHPLPIYDYESITEYPKGLLAPSENLEYNKFRSEHFDEIEKYLDQFEKTENASDEKVDKIFTQLLYLYAADYKGAKDLKEYGYIIFKKDGINPVTGVPLIEDIKVNIEIILDASGSMVKKIGDKTMMDIAKESIYKMLETLPENVNVGLRVYGHKGNNTVAEKEISCKSSELISPISKLDKSGIKEKLSSVTASGWTPIGESIRLGAEDFQKFQDNKNLNILYIISDGIETCNGDPVQSAKSIESMNVKPVMGIIGFNVNPSQELNLRNIAKAGRGYYATADTGEVLIKELMKIHEIAMSKYDWKSLDTIDIMRVSNRHTFEGNLMISNSMDFLIYHEAFTFEDMVRYLERTGKIDSITREKLFKKINDRNNKLHEIKREMKNKREMEMEKIRAEYTKRIGEEAYVILPEVN